MVPLLAASDTDTTCPTVTALKELVVTDGPSVTCSDNARVPAIPTLSCALTNDRGRAERCVDEVLERIDLFRSGEKLLIFTEAKDTLDYLAENLAAWGLRVNHIDGSMAPAERRAAELAFRDPAGAQVMVATEAAGEGINLQFCHLMINYDLPWNPARLEQRMGRIHRYGQKHDPVVIMNLVAPSTREGKVLKVLLDKLEKIGEQALLQAVITPPGTPARL